MSAGIGSVARLAAAAAALLALASCGIGDRSSKFIIRKGKASQCWLGWSTTPKRLQQPSYQNNLAIFRAGRQSCRCGDRIGLAEKKQSVVGGGRGRGGV